MLDAGARVKVAGSDAVYTVASVVPGWDAGSWVVVLDSAGARTVMRGCTTDTDGRMLDEAGQPFEVVEEAESEDGLDQRWLF